MCVNVSCGQAVSIQSELLWTQYWSKAHRMTLIKKEIIL